MPVLTQRRGRCLRLVSLLLALLAIAACVEIPTFSAQPTVSIRMAVPNQVQAVYLRERVQKYMREYPTIKVDVFSQMENFRGNLANAIANLSGSSNGLDIVYLTDQDFQSLGEAPILTDLTSFIRESEDLGPSQFYSIALPVFQNRGRQMVMPAELTPLVVYYNQDLFDRLSLKYPTADWTVQDFLFAAKRLTNETGGPQQATYGFVSDTTTALWQFLLAYGGALPDGIRDPGAQSLASPAAVQAFQFLADLIVRDKAFPIDPPGRTIGLWSGGRAGMTMLYMSSRNTISQVPDSRPSLATPTPGPKQSWGFRWDVVPVPGQEKRATLVQVAGYSITKGSLHPDESWQLIRYLVQTLPEPGAAPGYVPAYKSLARSTDFSRLYPEAGRRAYLDSIDFGQTMPPAPAAVRLTENDLRPIVRGEISVVDALQQIRKRYATAFEQAAQ